MEVIIHMKIKRNYMTATDSDESSMPPLVPRSDSFLDSNNDSTDKNYFTFHDDDSSIDESSTSTETHDDDDESVNSMTTAEGLSTGMYMNQFKTKRSLTTRVLEKW